MTDAMETTAGKVGVELADQLGTKVLEAVGGLPASPPAQQGAIARLIARRLDGWAQGREGLER